MTKVLLLALLLSGCARSTPSGSVDRSVVKSIGVAQFVQRDMAARQTPFPNVNWYKGSDFVYHYLRVIETNAAPIEYQILRAELDVPDAFPVTNDTTQWRQVAVIAQPGQPVKVVPADEAIYYYLHPGATTVPATRPFDQTDLRL